MVNHKVTQGFIAGDYVTMTAVAYYEGLYSDRGVGVGTRAMIIYGRRACFDWTRVHMFDFDSI